MSKSHRKSKDKEIRITTRDMTYLYTETVLVCTLNMKLFILLLLSIVPSIKSEVEVPVIVTKAGKVSGTLQKSFSGHDYYSYAGIPFAEPPTGDLRFRPPVPKKSWEGVKDGSKEGPPCLQVSTYFASFSSSFSHAFENNRFSNLMSPKSLAQKIVSG